MACHYEIIAPEWIRALDLRDEIAGLSQFGTIVECARVQIDDHAEMAEIVFVPGAGRLGCAWGAPAEWVDAASIEEYCDRTWGAGRPDPTDGAWVWRVDDAAAAWGVSPIRVRQYLRDGRVPGAVQLGRDWALPAGSPKPGDPRRR